MTALSHVPPSATPVCPPPKSVDMTEWKQQAGDVVDLYTQAYLAVPFTASCWHDPGAPACCCNGSTRSGWATPGLQLINYYRHKKPYYSQLESRSTQPILDSKRYQVAGLSDGGVWDI